MKRKESQLDRHSESLVVLDESSIVGDKPPTELNTKPRSSELDREEPFMVGRLRKLELNFQGSVGITAPLSARYNY
jgi:hypothetical protein